MLGVICEGDDEDRVRIWLVLHSLNTDIFASRRNSTDIFAPIRIDIHTFRQQISSQIRFDAETLRHRNVLVLRRSGTLTFLC